MADPPWDMHMDLPYGALPDDEMKKFTCEKVSRWWRYISMGHRKGYRISERMFRNMGI